MQVLQSSLNFVKQFETLTLYPIRKPNNAPWLNTIGYNMKAYPNGTMVALTDRPISESEAEQYLAEVLQYKLEGLKGIFTFNFNQNQTDALLDLLYDVGVTKFLRSSLARAIYYGESEENIRAAFLQFKDPTRRQAEADLYFVSTK